MASGIAAIVPAFGRVLLVAGLLPAAATAAEFQLTGRVFPEAAAAVELHGATSPFSASTRSDPRGRFQFRKLLAGPYTLIVMERGFGEVRRTVEVGPSLADDKGRINVVIDLRDSKPESGAAQSKDTVSVAELDISDAAWREYDEATKKLGERDVPAAVAHLERAVRMAPKFAIAWNRLGTIAYQTQRYPEAESDFRKALQGDPNAFEPLVNLGGVLINLGRYAEALEYNQSAVRRRPNDALANSQLGLAYYRSGNLDLAEKYLLAAQQIDPAHFSQPQRALAEIYLKRNQPAPAAAELEDLLKRHPDLADAGKIKQVLARLRQSR